MAASSWLQHASSCSWRRRRSSSRRAQAQTAKQPLAQAQEEEWARAGQVAKLVAPQPLSQAAPAAAAAAAPPVAAAPTPPTPPFAARVRAKRGQHTQAAQALLQQDSTSSAAAPPVDVVARYLADTKANDSKAARSSGPSGRLNAPVQRFSAAEDDVILEEYADPTKRQGGRGGGAPTRAAKRINEMRGGMPAATAAAEAKFKRAIGNRYTKLRRRQQLIDDSWKSQFMEALVAPEPVADG